MVNSWDSNPSTAELGSLLWSSPLGSPGGTIIDARMRLGDLLVRARLVTAEQVSAAMALQGEKGGRLGDHLVALNAITQSDLDAFLHRMPTEPRNVAATNLDINEILTLMMKVIEKGRLESVRQFADAIKLPTGIVIEVVRLAVDRKLLFSLGRPRNRCRPGDELWHHRRGQTLRSRRDEPVALRRPRTGHPAGVYRPDQSSEDYQRTRHL